MGEVMTPKKFNFIVKKARDIDLVELSSVQELVELAKTLGAKLVFRAGKEYMFFHEGLIYSARE